MRRTTVECDEILPKILYFSTLYWFIYEQTSCVSFVDLFFIWRWFSSCLFLSIFQVLVEGVVGSSYKGDIAIDDLSFSDGCMLVAGKYRKNVFYGRC